jgi:hypothetical protein
MSCSQTQDDYAIFWNSLEDMHYVATPNAGDMDLAM